MIIIVAIVVVVICCMISGMNDNSKKAVDIQNEALADQQRAIAAQAAAKRPEAFAKLFAEEFPDFAGEITYAKAQAMLLDWDKALKAKEYKRALTWSGKAYKDYHTGQKAKKYVLQRVGAHVSPAFLQQVENHVDESLAAMQRVVDSSLVLSRG